MFQIITKAMAKRPRRSDGLERGSVAGEVRSCASVTKRLYPHHSGRYSQKITLSRCFIQGSQLRHAGVSVTRRARPLRTSNAEFHRGQGSKLVALTQRLAVGYRSDIPVKTATEILWDCRLRSTMGLSILKRSWPKESGAPHETATASTFVGPAG
jgi:hypothetical protein